ncbi:dual specificity protein phosphatase family protein [candidate division CSSED10-310 bacterium]|uniref:Dual specificity protein phosphatase family protein n=1 Tax=candidate division CSSED10-310 bacterium TaxID=2855610 RepID=A0ABV6YX77_UNCC1
MRYGIFFFIGGISSFYCSTVMAFPGSVILVWTGFSFFIVALAYFKLGPWIIGKKADGMISFFNKILLWPYFIVTWSLWHIYRLLSDEDPLNELVPHIFIGRRLLSSEMRPEIDLVLDLTCEFTEPGEIVSQKQYFCLPILDAATPQPEDLLALINVLNAASGTIFIHCAQGHGRTAMVAAALLLSRGLAVDVRDAISLIAKKRPKIHLQRNQYEFVSQFCMMVKS